MTRRWAFDMLLGRFGMIIPLLALAGSLAKKKIVPASVGNIPGERNDLYDFARRHGATRRRADLFACARAWADRRTFPDAGRTSLLIVWPPNLSPSLIRKLSWPAIGDAFMKLNPRLMIKNPVMFVTMVGAAISTVDIFRSPRDQIGFVIQIAIWLWFTVLFANFAEAVAEGRGKAQAKALRATRTRTNANKVSGERIEVVDADSLRKDDVVVVRADGNYSRRRRDHFRRGHGG